MVCHTVLYTLYYLHTHIHTYIPRMGRVLSFGVVCVFSEPTEGLHRVTVYIHVCNKHYLPIYIYIHIYIYIYIYTTQTHTLSCTINHTNITHLRKGLELGDEEDYP